MMTLFPLIDCSKMLTIDPKTLRSWLLQAKMPLHPHPTDARVKCLSLEQVSHLAAISGRVLAFPTNRARSLVEASPLGELEEPIHSTIASQNAPLPILCPPLLQGSDLIKKLTHLETQVATLQEQLVHLTRELVDERQHGTERSLHASQALLQPMAEQVKPDGKGRRLHPAEQRAEQRAHFLVLPSLIEYGAAGTYVVISSQEGELHLIADSPEWFEWFRTLSSFRFVGKSGHFGACRGYNRRPTRTWYAHRTLHQHEYRHYLGLSEHLTVAHLEQMADRLQSYV